MIRVWVDDVRNPEQWYYEYEGWIWARIYQEAIVLLQTGQVEQISLDHDLGGTKAGYDIICWIEDRAMNYRMRCPEIWCHSWNPVGRKRIQIVIERLKNRMEVEL